MPAMDEDHRLTIKRGVNARHSRIRAEKAHKEKTMDSIPPDGKPEPFTINHPRMAHPAEHEVWFSFNDDADDQEFHGWWYAEGQELSALWMGREKEQAHG